MLKKVFASAVFGVEASTVIVEVNVDKGVGYHLVGLPDNAIKRVILELRLRFRIMATEFLEKRLLLICRPQICVKKVLRMI